MRQQRFLFVKRASAGRAALTAAAVDATVMLAFSVTHDNGSTPTAGSRAAVVAEPPTENTSPQLKTQSAPSPAPATLSPQQSEELAEQVEAAARKVVPGTDIGMQVYDRDTDKVVTSLNAGQTFSSMPVVKLLIAVDELASDDWALPDATTQARITRMLSASDDAIASAMWSQDGGGTAIITRDVQLMHLTGTEPPADPGEWGDTKITAQDLVTVYRYLEDDLPDTAQNLLYNAMYNASETAADGTDQYFGIPDGLPGSVWAIKQGWGSTGSTAYYNTTGLVGQDAQYVVIVLSSAPVEYYHTLGRALTAGTAQLASVLSGTRTGFSP